MAYKSDQDRIEKTHNLPRFFVEHPQVSWVLLMGVLVWGWFGYHSMPQRKDPDIPVRVAVAFCPGRGAPDPLPERFRGYRGTHADRGQSEGRPGRNQYSSARDPIRNRIGPGKKETHRTRCASRDRLLFPSINFSRHDARRSTAVRATSR